MFDAFLIEIWSFCFSSLLVAWLQREHQILEFVDGNGNAGVGLKLHNKPSSGDLNRQFPLGNCTKLDRLVMLCLVEMSLVFVALYTVFFSTSEIPPILFEDSSLPAGLHSSHVGFAFSCSDLLFVFTEISIEFLV